MCTALYKCVLSFYQFLFVLSNRRIVPPPDLENISVPFVGMTFKLEYSTTEIKHVQGQQSERTMKEYVHESCIANYSVPHGISAACRRACDVVRIRKLQLQRPTRSSNVNSPTEQVLGRSLASLRYGVRVLSENAITMVLSKR